MDPRHGTNEDPARYEWSYIDNLRAEAERFGTINETGVQKLLAKLEERATSLYGPRASKP